MKNTREHLPLLVPNLRENDLCREMSSLRIVFFCISRGRNRGNGRFCSSVHAFLYLRNSSDQIEINSSGVCSLDVSSESKTTLTSI